MGIVKGSWKCEFQPLLSSLHSSIQTVWKFPLNRVIFEQNILHTQNHYSITKVKLTQWKLLGGFLILNGEGWSKIMKVNTQLTFIHSLEVRCMQCNFFATHRDSDIIKLLWTSGFFFCEFQMISRLIEFECTENEIHIFLR